MESGLIFIFEPDQVMRLSNIIESVGFNCLADPSSNLRADRVVLKLIQKIIFKVSYVPFVIAIANVSHIWLIFSFCIV